MYAPERGSASRTGYEHWRRLPLERPVDPLRDNALKFAFAHRQDPYLFDANVVRLVRLSAVRVQFTVAPFLPIHNEDGAVGAGEIHRNENLEVSRRLFRPADEEDCGGAGGPKLDADAPSDPESEFGTARRQSWARLLRKILEVDPLLCPQCQVEMKIVSVITDPMVVDAILRHVEEGGGHDPHAPRAPPAA